MGNELFQHIYIHFPFCETKCHYCDFFSFPEEKIPQSTKRHIYDSLLKELEQARAHITPTPQTVFLGGGTPSLVPLEVLEKIASNLNFNLMAQDGEVTLEVNPSSVTADKARAWKALGINRISMGMQALDDSRLKWLGRIHDVSNIFRTLTTLLSAGFNNISVDYILGVPGQTPRIIQQEMNELFSHFPEIKHISAYLLTLQQTNPKFSQLPSEDIQLEHLLCSHDVLTQKGFQHYEVSNFAKPSFQAKHNTCYWQGAGYLGLGPSAHSFWPLQKKRTKNFANLEKYSHSIAAQQNPWEWHETLTPEQERLEFIMLRLRQSTGLSFAEYKSYFYEDLLEKNLGKIQTLAQDGLCQFTTQKLSLTTNGLFASDKIINEII